MSLTCIGLAQFLSGGVLFWKPTFKSEIHLLKKSGFLNAENSYHSLLFYFKFKKVHVGPLITFVFVTHLHSLPY